MVAHMPTHAHVAEMTISSHIGDARVALCRFTPIVRHYAITRKPWIFLLRIERFAFAERKTLDTEIN